jgi:hypothetical protein
MGAAESAFLTAASEGDTQAAIELLDKEGKKGKKRLLRARDKVRKLDPRLERERDIEA